jgi:hypothetical protein
MTNALETIQPQRTQRMGITPANLGEAMEMAKIMAQSSIVPKDYQGNPGNVLVAIQWGAEIGLPPLQAMQNIAVINGRPSIWGDAALAIVRSSGSLEYIRETQTATEATCTIKRVGEPEEVRTFSVEDSKRAGLSGKQGPWTQYPRRMMQMRARSWAIRDVFPDVLRGCHIAEEAQDMPERNMGDAKIVEDPSANRTESVKAKLAARTSKPADPPGPSLDAVLQAIADAQDLDSLKAVPAAKLASDDDKAKARKAYKARAAELKSETAKPEPEPLDLTPPTLVDSLIEAARTAENDDDRAEIMDAAKDLPESDRDRVAAAFNNGGNGS